MARVIDIRRGADGAAHVACDDGSLFISRDEYLATACQAEGLAWPPLEGEAPPFDAPAESLANAADALKAEKSALALLARAEQYRAGLERKLSAKDYPRPAVRQALDRLEAEGLLSDLRYASAWIRQRMRGRAEGPRSIAAALAAKGVARGAASEAMRAHREEAGDTGLIACAYSFLAADGVPGKEARAELARLGWRRSEIEDVLSSLEP